MCWSGEASFALATVGLGGAALSCYHQHTWRRWLPLAYFSGMELLQGFTYGWIDQCHSPVNQSLTTASYLHIAFQPFLVNLFASSFVPRARRLDPRFAYVWLLCGVVAALMLLKVMYPLWPSPCDPSSMSLCGTQTCAFHGDWHIAWVLRLSSLDPHWVSYWLAAFVLPLLYGSWRWPLFHLVAGPVLASLLTTNPHEVPAIWCLFSIALLSATHVPFLRTWLEGRQPTETP